jgi:hypothetical protein
VLNGERSRTCEYSEEKLNWSGELPSCQQNLFTPIPPNTENNPPPILTPNDDDEEQSVWSLLKENQIVIGISAGVFLLILTLSVMLAYCIRKKRTGKDNSELEIHNMWDRNPTLNENTYTDQIVTSGPNRDNSISDPSQTFYQPNHNRAQYPIRGGNVSPYSQQNVGNVGNSENDHLLTVDECGPSIYDPSNADQAQYPSSRGPSQNQNYYRPNMATFIY